MSAHSTYSAYLRQFDLYISSFAHPSQVHSGIGCYSDRVNTMFEIIRGGMMARNGKSSKSGSSFPEIEFIDLRLDAAQKEEFLAWKKAAGEDSYDIVTDFVGTGHKLSVTWDDNGNCFIASFTCKDERSANIGKCITSRSDTWFEAIMLGVFKAQVVFKGAAWLGASRKDSWG